MPLFISQKKKKGMFESSPAVTCYFNSLIVKESAFLKLLFLKFHNYMN